MMQKLFVVFALLTQGLLFSNFAARLWQPSLERQYGWIVYALGIPALFLGILYIADGQPWMVAVAPLVYAAWAALGYYVDIYAGIPWRTPPIWPVFLPYVTLFMAAQFFFWIPLWSMGVPYWIAYTLLYVLNTALNIGSHFIRRPIA